MYNSFCRWRFNGNKMIINASETSTISRSTDFWRLYWSCVYSSISYHRRGEGNISLRGIRSTRKVTRCLNCRSWIWSWKYSLVVFLTSWFSKSTLYTTWTKGCVMDDNRRMNDSEKNIDNGWLSHANSDMKRICFSVLGQSTRAKVSRRWGRI